MPDNSSVPSEAEMREGEDYVSKMRETARALTDAELIARAKFDFSPAFWERFYVLAARLHEETMTTTEQQEFLTYTDRAEAWTVDRLILLMELSSRRGVPVLDLIKQLGLRTGSDGAEDSD